MHTECPLSYAQILKTMPTDEDIDLLYETYKNTPSSGREPVEWGEGVVWNELHHKTELLKVNRHRKDAPCAKDY